VIGRPEEEPVSWVEDIDAPAHLAQAKAFVAETAARRRRREVWRFVRSFAAGVLIFGIIALVVWAVGQVLHDTSPALFQSGADLSGGW